MHERETRMLSHVAFYRFFGFVKRLLCPLGLCTGLLELYSFQLACSCHSVTICCFGSAAMVHELTPLWAPHKIVIYESETTAPS